MIYQIYMALKQTSKIMGEITYSWNQYIKIVEMILQRIIEKKKIEKANLTKNTDEEDMMRDSLNSTVYATLRDIEIDVDSKFFTSEVVPMIHQTMMSNVKIESYTFFNLILSLKLGL